MEQQEEITGFRNSELIPIKLKSDPKKQQQQQQQNASVIQILLKASICKD